MRFEDLGLTSTISQATTEAGYTIPTPIQEQAIPAILMGRDILGSAPTGTGKTASFILPMVDILASGRTRARMPRSLVLVPTRELAAQVAKNFETYSKYSKLSWVLLIGGEPFAEQERKIERGVDVLIATPGRLLDIIQKGKILLNDMKILVIDEADRMLDMGFIPDIDKLMPLLPTTRQTLLFSATMPDPIRILANTYLRNPKEIIVSRAAAAAITVKQVMVELSPRQKPAALRTFLKQENAFRTVIFCNRKKNVQALKESLEGDGFSVGALHGDMAQSKRHEVLDFFKNGTVSILVASDVAARGLDIDDLSHVINFDVPLHPEDYIHRIGRTGRAGKTGTSLTFVTPLEKGAMKSILETTQQHIELLDLALDASLKAEKTEQSPKKHTSSERIKREARTPRVSPSNSSINSNKKETDIVLEQAEEIIVTPKKSVRTRNATPLKPRSSFSQGSGLKEKNSDNVLGFGDHLPAFFKHSVRPSVSKS